MQWYVSVLVRFHVHVSGWTWHLKDRLQYGFKSKLLHRVDRNTTDLNSKVGKWYQTLRISDLAVQGDRVRDYNPTNDKERVGWQKSSFIILNGMQTNTTSIDPRLYLSNEIFLEYRPSWPRLPHLPQPGR